LDIPQINLTVATGVISLPTTTCGYDSGVGTQGEAHQVVRRAGEGYVERFLGSEIPKLYLARCTIFTARSQIFAVGTEGGGVSRIPTEGEGLSQ
jgi:hypothetical protein